MKSVQRADVTTRPRHVRSVTASRPAHRPATDPAAGSEQVVIEGVEPATSDGQLAVKAVVGDTIAVEATVFRHGHERVRAAVQWSGPVGDTVSDGRKAAPPG